MPIDKENMVPTEETEVTPEPTEEGTTPSVETPAEATE